MKSSKFAVVLAALLLLPSSASAVSLSNTVAAPVDTQAGGHSNFTTSFEVSDMGAVDSGDDLSSFRLDLPIGMVGDPSVADVCSLTDLSADTCPASSEVGQTTTVADLLSPYVGAFNDQDIEGTVYNIAVQGTEAARLGIVLRPEMHVGPLTLPLPKTVLQSEIRLRTVATPAGMPAGGLASVTDDLPSKQEVPTVPPVIPFLPMGVPGHDADIQIKEISLTLNGVVNGKSFLTMPTLCVQPATTMVSVETVDGDNAFSLASFQPTGCAAVPFAPTFEVSSSSNKADTITSVSTVVGLPYTDNPAVLGSSQPRIAQVLLPVGFELSSTVATGTIADCTDAQLAKTSSAPSTCPAASEIGTVVFASPLIPSPMQGKVYLAKAPTPSVNRIFIVAQQSDAVDALRIKLIGTVSADADTGQVKTVLTDLPPVPFTAFTLAFRGGDSAVFGTPRTCGTKAASAAFYPYSAPATPTGVGATTSITEDCAPAVLAPSYELLTSSSAAGQYTDLTTRITRPDRSARLKDVSVLLPAGLTGKLAGMPRCTVEQANSDSCPASTQVGVVNIDTGVGANVLASAGKVYLTEPIDGSLAGLAFITPANVGPLELGRVTAFGRLTTNADASLNVEVKNIPQRLLGVALNIRSMSITMNYPSFVMNATSCNALSSSISVVGDDASTGSASAPYQVSGCDALAYSPLVSGRLNSNTAPKPGDEVSVTVDVEQAAGQANSQKITTTLPEGIASNLDQVKQACLPEQYTAGQCPAASVVGSATAVTPLLDKPLSGPVRILRVEGQVLPDLMVDLSGEINISLRGRVSFSQSGQIVNTFDNLPDTAITRFSLTIDGPNGANKGLLTVGRSLCGTNPKIIAQMVAKNGKTASSSEAFISPENGCPATKRSTKTKVKITHLNSNPHMRVVATGTDLSKVIILLPKDVTFVKHKARKANVTLTGTKGKAKVKMSGKRTMTVTVPKGTKSVNVLIKRGSLKPTKKRAASKKTVSVKTTVSSRSVSKYRKTWKVKQSKRL